MTKDDRVEEVRQVLEWEGASSAIDALESLSTELQALRQLDEARPLREVAHAAWHLLDEGGEHPEDAGLRVVSARDWERLSSALDIAGWTDDQG